MSAGNRRRFSVILSAMRVTTNLSSRPFRNRRLLWIGALFVALGSAGTILWVAQAKAQVAREIVEEQDRIAEQRHEFEKAKEEREQREREERAIVISEQEAYQLAAARLLLQRKSLSWSRIMSDLEAYVPEDTRITSVQVQEVSEAGSNLTARILIKAVGKAAAEMTTMMASLDKSHGVFYVGEVTQEAVDDSGEVPFTINLMYRPHLREEQ